MNRNINELLIILRDYIKEMDDFDLGLCHIISVLFDVGLINQYEYFVLKDYVNYNKPKWYSKHFSPIQLQSPYYWKKGNKTPRLKWLDTQIKITKHD